VRLLIVGLIVAIVGAGVAFAVHPPGGEQSGSSASETEQFSDRFQPYSEEALAAADVDDTVVLFFSAAWCSTCKVLRDDIRANQASIPEDVRILLVDFDAATELKQTYGVIRQHSLVQVDRTGTGIARWELSRSLDEVLATIVEP
jgi:thiol:disulfide interchange protein